MSIPAKLQRSIEDFLGTRSRSEGGYAPVGEKDLEQLSRIINGLIQAKYEKDPDGDLPVNFDLVDRTRFERAYFNPIPHLRENDYKDIAAISQVLSAATSNAAIAQEQVSRIQRVLTMGVLEDMKKGLPVRAGDRVFEATTALTDRTAFIEAAKSRAASYLKAHPAPLEDFTAYQAWQREAAKALTKALGAPVELSSRAGREPGSINATLNLVCFQDECLFHVPAEPAGQSTTARKPGKP